MAPLLQRVISGGLLVGVASIQQESYSGPKNRFWNMFGTLPDNAPEWCKSESALTWEEKRQRIAQHATLMWAKQTVKDLRETNQTIPQWMDDMVTKDARQGQMKWAVQEAKRLKAEGKDVPEWMAALVEEDNKWANRWAACKAAELQLAGETPPVWMVENGRKGVFAAATEKLAEIQEQLDELEALKEKEVALIQARGDIRLAERRMVKEHRPTAARRQAPPPKKWKKPTSDQAKPAVLNLEKKAVAAPLPEVSFFGQ